jgi:septation ring formation regulator EzrA
MKASQLRELIRELIKTQVDEMSTTGALVQPGGQQIATTKAFTSMRDWKKVNKNRTWEESVNESYRRFKKKVTNPRQQMNNSVREIEKHLREVDRIVEYNLKLKTEMDLGGGNFFEGTNKRLARISERINHLNNKLKELGN